MTIVVFFEVVESKRGLFKPSTNLQRYFNRVIVVSDCAHAIGTTRDGVSVAKLADFASFSFHAVKNLTTAERWMYYMESSKRIGF